ncbi:MAG: zinc ribbon domain-containing protein [bacterium]
MPIYEFSCEPCHTLFNFLAKRVNTTATPPCPRCAAALSRQVSAFAHLRGGKNADGAADDGSPPMDEARMEQAMAAMGSELDTLGDDTDPRQAATLMRRFAQASGMKFNGAVEEALNRMASGEDPEAVEAEFGDALESANPFASDADGGTARTDQLKRLLRATGPRKDPKLYDL